MSSNDSMFDVNSYVRYMNADLTETLNSRYFNEFVLSKGVRVRSPEGYITDFIAVLKRIFTSCSPSDIDVLCEKEFPELVRSTTLENEPPTWEGPQFCLHHIPEALHSKVNRRIYINLSQTIKNHLLFKCKVYLFWKDGRVLPRTLPSLIAMLRADKKPEAAHLLHWESCNLIATDAPTLFDALAITKKSINKFLSYYPVRGNTAEEWKKRAEAIDTYSCLNTCHGLIKHFPTFLTFANAMLSEILENNACFDFNKAIQYLIDHNHKYDCKNIDAGHLINSNKIYTFDPDDPYNIAMLERAEQGAKQRAKQRASIFSSPNLSSKTNDRPQKLNIVSTKLKSFTGSGNNVRYTHVLIGNVPDNQFKFCEHCGVTHIPGKHFFSFHNPSQLIGNKKVASKLFYLYKPLAHKHLFSNSRKRKRTSDTDFDSQTSDDVDSIN